jgi:hypothetical protein
MQAWRCGVHGPGETGEVLPRRAALPEVAPTAPQGTVAASAKAARSPAVPNQAVERIVGQVVEGGDDDVGVERP